MIPAVAQSLANLLVSGTSIDSGEQIDFSHPKIQNTVKPRLNLYFYDLRLNSQTDQSAPARWQNLPREESRLQSLTSHSSAEDRPLVNRENATVETDTSLIWHDVRFLLSACDHTSLGEQQLLSESLMLLQTYPALPEALLPPVLKGHGALPFYVGTAQLADTVALWNALRVPLRPALHLTVSVPFKVSGLPPPQSSPVSELFQQ
ncbi:MAG: Pvc16 family protein [Cyanobacteria bacterium J06635_15]